MKKLIYLFIIFALISCSDKEVHSLENCLGIDTNADTVMIRERYSTVHKTFCNFDNSAYLYNSILKYGYDVAITNNGKLTKDIFIIFRRTNDFR